MPDVLDYFREKDPRFKKVPDKELASYIKDKYPDFAGEMKDKPYFSGTKSSTRTDFQNKALSNKRGLEAQSHADVQDQETSNAKAKFVGDVSKAIPVAATLATGGLAAPLAIGVMGGAGLAAGTYEEAAKYALQADDTSGFKGITGMGEKNEKSGGAATSPKQLAQRLGIDMAVNAGTQGAAEVGSTLLSLAGSKVLQPMVARAAAKVDAGQKILETYGVKMLNKIRNFESFAADAASKPAAEAGSAIVPAEGARVGGFPTMAEAAQNAKIPVAIDKELSTLEARIAARGTGLSDAFKARWPGMAEKFTKWDGSLSQLTEIKGSLSQMAHDAKAGFNFEEKAALKEFSEGVDKKLGDKFLEVGGKEGKALYDGYKETQDQLFRFSAARELAEQTISGMAKRAGYGLAGAGIGGYEGYRVGGVTGAVKGAVAGAVAGTAAKAVAEKGAPWLLEKMLSDKALAPEAASAITHMVNGNSKEALAIMSRAASQIGADKVFKSVMKEQADQQAAQPQGGQ